MRLPLVLCALTVLLRAQSGVVRSGNQPIPGATVTATQGSQKVVTTTNEKGRYAFSGSGDGSWTIEVRMFGFEPVTKEMNFAAAKTADFSLKPAESPMAARLARLAGNRGQTSNQLETQIQNEINASQGQQAAAPATAQSSNEAFLVSGSLSRGLAQNAPADFAGGPLPGAERPGGIGEFFPQTQGPPGFRGGPGNFGGHGPAGPGGPGGHGGFRHAGGPRPGAQFGNRRQPGAFHGMLFFTLNNSALDAKPFSITGQEISQPAWAQSRFGVVAGGPLVIPKIVKDTSTNFFVSYFGARARNPYTAVETVPTLLEREGNFSQSIQSGGPVRIFDPTTHQPIAGNVIPANRLDPIARALLRYFPAPNQPGLVNNYQFQTAVPQDSDNFNARIQRNIGARDRLAYRAGFQRRNGDVAQPFGFLDTTSGYGFNTELTWTRNFNPATISSARVSFNRNRNQTTPFFAYGGDVAGELGIAGTSPNPINFGPPNLNFTNYGSLSDGTPVLTRNQGETAGESIILARGSHTFTLGLQYGRNNLSSRTDPNGRGAMNFTGQATSAYNPDGAPVQGTGFDLADFLLGLPQSSSIRYSDSGTYFRQNVWSGFGQDDWKVTPNLSLELGLRYEYFSPFSEKYGRLANLDIAPAFTAVARVLPGDTGPYSGKVPPGIIHPDYNNFSPRLGLAWNISKMKRSTIVRAGYGIYYNGQAFNLFPSRLAQQPPFAIASSINTSPQDVLTLASGFVSVLPNVLTNTYAVSPYYRTPYAQTWSLTIQHDLPKGFFVEVGYLGTKGTRLDVVTVPNQGPPGTRQTIQLGNARGFTFASSVGNSILHSLQVRATQRFRRGISMSASYALSKSIDDSSTFGGAGNTVAQNWLNLAAERGLSSFDRRHSFDMNWVLTSPLTGRLWKDWQLSGGLRAQTGAPLTARILGNTASLAQTGGVGSGRAQATGADISSGSGFFNLAAFTVPPAGQFGNAGRNTIPGPGLFTVNLGFGRSFQLDETRRRLELRMESSNVFNQVNYTNINTVVNATNYGLPIAASSMRTVSAVLRFRF